MTLSGRTQLRGDWRSSCETPIRKAKVRACQLGLPRKPLSGVEALGIGLLSGKPDLAVDELERFNDMLYSSVRVYSVPSFVYDFWYIVAADIFRKPLLLQWP